MKEGPLPSRAWPNLPSPRTERFRNRSAGSKPCQALRYRNVLPEAHVDTREPFCPGTELLIAPKLAPVLQGEVDNYLASFEDQIRCCPDLTYKDAIRGAPDLRAWIDNIREGWDNLATYYEISRQESSTVTKRKAPSQPLTMVVGPMTMAKAVCGRWALRKHDWSQNCFISHELRLYGDSITCDSIT